MQKEKSVQKRTCKGGSRKQAYMAGTPNAKLNTVATFPALRATVLTHNEQYGAYRYFPEVEETILKIQKNWKPSKNFEKNLETLKKFGEKF